MKRSEFEKAIGHPIASSGEKPQRFQPDALPSGLMQEIKRDYPNGFAPLKSSGPLPSAASPIAPEPTWFNSAAISNFSNNKMATALETQNDLLLSFESGVAEVPDALQKGIAGILGSEVKDRYDGRKIAYYLEPFTPFIIDHNFLTLLAGLHRTYKRPSYEEAEKAKREYSVLGDKSRGLIKSGGQMTGEMLLANVGIPRTATLALSSLGGEMESALAQGATRKEALASGTISAAGEVLSEKMFDVVPFEGKALFEGLSDKAVRGIKNSVVASLAKIGIDAISEGSEEIVSSLVSRLGQRLTYESDKSLKEMFASKEALQDYVDSFIGGAVMGSVFSSANAINAKAHGVDFGTGMTKTERQVVDSIYKNTLNNADHKLSGKEKSKIYTDIQADMAQGNISIEYLQKVLSPELDNKYRSMIQEQNDLINEYNSIVEQGVSNDPHDPKRQRAFEIQDILEKTNHLVVEARNNLLTETARKVRGTQLEESYREAVRSGRKFEFDSSRYSGKTLEFYQHVQDSGIVNDTNASHKTVDFLARLVEDGLDIRIADADTMRQLSGMENAPNGIKANGSIYLNWQSGKLNEVITGHELTHFLQGADSYQALRDTVIDYAKANGIYDERMEGIRSVYGEGTDYDGELVADLVGEKLFSDPDFVHTLATRNKPLAQKIYDGIKHLCKMAFGTPQERQLEKMRTQFLEAYQEGLKADPSTDGGGMEFSIAKTSKIPYEEQLRQIENRKMNGSNSLYVGVPPDSLQRIGFSDAPLAMNQADYRKSRREKGNNPHYSSHGVSVEFFENMPAYLSDAAMFIDNGEKVTVITSYPMKDRAGNDSYVIVGVTQDQSMDNGTVNLIKSAYPWDGFATHIQEAANHGRLVVTNKNKAEQMLAAIGIQTSEASSVLDLAKDSLSQNSDAVKGNMKYSLDPAESLESRLERYREDPKFMEGVENHHNARAAEDARRGNAKESTDAETVPLERFTQNKNYRAGLKKVYEHISETGNMAWAVREGLSATKNLGGALSNLFKHHGVDPTAFYSDYMSMDYSGFAKKWEPKFSGEDFNTVMQYSHRAPYGSGSSVVDRIKESAYVVPYAQLDSARRAKVNDTFRDIIHDLWMEAEYEASDPMLDNPKFENPAKAASFFYEILEHDAEYARYYYDVYLESGKNTANMEFSGGADSNILNQFFGAIRSAGRQMYVLDGMKERGFRAPEAHRTSDIAPIRSDISAQGDSALNRVPSVTEDIAPIRKDIPGRPPSGAEPGSTSHQTDAPIAPAPDVATVGNIAPGPASAQADTASPVSEERAKIRQTVERIRGSEPGDTKAKPKSEREQFARDRFYDSIPADVREKTGKRWDAVKKATDAALDFVLTDSYGGRPVNDIFTEVREAGIGDEFDSYLLHLLNVDHMTLQSRFGIENKPVWNIPTTAESSRQEAARLEAKYPQFAKLREEVYRYNNALRDALAEGGVITQETADLWAERYPHYVPVKRAGFGDESKITDMLGFLLENQDTALSLDEAGNFVTAAEATAPTKEFVGSGRQILPIGDTMVSRAFQTFWSVALNEANTGKASKPGDLGPIRKDLPKISNTFPMFPDVTMAMPERNRTYQQSLEINEELGSLVERDALKDFEPTLQERFGEGRKTALTQFEEYVIDNGFVFEKLSKKIGDRSLEASWNNIRNARARAEYLIAHGDAEKGVRSLMDIEKQIRKTGAANDFNSYMAYRAQADGLTIKQRTALFDNFSFAQDVSASDAQARVAALETIHPEFRALAADVDTYVANVQNLLVESHVIDQGTLDLWHELLPTYVPVQTTDAGIASITDSLADWTGKVERAVSTNSFAQKLEGVLKTGKDGTDPFNFRRFVKSLEYGRMNDFSTTQDYRYRYYADGKMRTMEVTPEMYEAMKKSSAIWGTSIKGLSSFSDARRKIITEYNPYFLLKNAVRDIQDVIINSQHAVQTYGSIPRAMTEYFTKGVLYQEYARNGGTANSYFQSDKKKLDLEKRSKAVQTIGKGLDCLSEANNFVEMMPRFAEYIASREMGRSVEVSLLDSARVTTNFAAGGKLTKLLNRNGCTFLNASVQGTTQFARNFYEAKTNGFKAWASLAGRLTIAGVLPEILNGLIWDDDDEYEEQPDYIKDNYFLIGKFGDGQFFRIPKGRAVAALNASMKYVSENPSGDDRMDFERYVKILADNLAPNNPFTDNVFAPAYQALVSKKTWYGEDITPRRLKDLPEDEQYDEKTSSLAIWLAEKIDGVNPKQVHYLLDNYSGVIGDMLLPLTTPKAESDIDNPFGKTLLAPLKNEFTTDSVLNSRIVGDFYDKMEAMDTKQQGARATKDEQALASHYIYANAEISKLFAQERQIQTSGLPDSEKYPKVRQIRKQILGIMRDTMNNQDVKRTGNYAVIGGSRYNYDPERKRWFKIQVKNADGTENFYAKQEKQVTAALGISQEEYWNNRQKYDDIYYVGYGYDKDSSEDDSIITGKYVFGLDQFGNYAGKLKTFKADKDEHGESIPGTKKKKVRDYVYSLDIPEAEKHILFKSQYKHENKHNYEIIDYLNEREDITYKQMEDILTELGMVVDSNGYITW